MTDQPTTVAQHTPGPWEWTQDGGTEIVARTQVDLAGRLITVAQAIDHYCDGHPALESEEIEANAHLIAAAPELLEALRGLVKAEFAEDLKPYWTKAHAAIDKAEGREP